MVEENNSLKKSLVILVVFILVIVFVVLFLYFQKNEFFNGEKEMTPEEKIKLQNEFSEIIEQKNPKLCNNLDEKYQDACYIQMGLALENYSLCERDVEDNLIYLRDECFFKWAQSEKDISICDKIEGEGEYYKDKWQCYLSISHSEKDISICDKIDNKKVQSRCYYLFSIEGDDSSVCEKVEETDTTSVNNCYVNVAVNAKDVSLCEKISGSKDTCYILLAKEIGDSQICEKVLGVMEDSNLTLKDSCYLQFASERKDPSVCERFNDPYIKESCIVNAQ